MKDVLMSHSVANLKKMISAYNIRGYSKMKKPELIDMMTSPEHIGKFRHIKAKGGKMPTKDSKVVAKPKAKVKPPPPPKTPPPKKKADDVDDETPFSTMFNDILKKKSKPVPPSYASITKDDKPKPSQKLLKKIRRGATRDKGQLKRLDALTKKNEPKKVAKKASSSKTANTPQYQKLLDRKKERSKKKRELKPDSPKTARKFAKSILGDDDEPKTIKNKKKGETDKEYNDRYFKQLQKKRELNKEIKDKRASQTDNPMTKAEDKILEGYEKEMADELPKRKMTDAELIKASTKIEKKYLKLLRGGKLKKKK